MNRAARTAFTIRKTIAGAKSREEGREEAMGENSHTSRALTRRSFSVGAGASLLAGAGALTPRDASAQQSILWYSASSSAACDDWAKGFKEKTSIGVEYFRIGGVKLTERIEQEMRTKQLRLSVMDISIPGLMTVWARKGMLLEYDSPEARHYPADLRLPGYWTPVNTLTLSMAYNGDHIKPDEAPRTWEDLLHPKWKGKMAMSDALYSGAALHWYAALRSVYGKSFMEKLAKQDILIRNGSGETTDTITTGERPLAAMLLDYYVVAAMKKGANLYLVQPEEGIPASYEVIGIPSGAPNPDAAKKFVDFALSRGPQELWEAKHGTVSLRQDITPAFAERGRRPIQKTKLMASSVKDIETFFPQQRDLLDEWIALFK
jgi:iron(III) transport system substrate-binding protein